MWINKTIGLLLFLLLVPVIGIGRLFIGKAPEGAEYGHYF